MQFGTIAEGLANDGAIKDIFVSQLPTNPRMAGGEFASNPEDIPWALTFVTSNFNVSLTALQGPQFVFDNATIWAGANFSAALPYIERAHDSVPPVSFCIDEIAGSETPRCMSQRVVNQFQESRASTEMVGPQFGAGPSVVPPSSPAPPAGSGVRSGSGAGGAAGQNRQRGRNGGRGAQQAEAGDSSSAVAWVAPLSIILAAALVLSALPRTCGASELKEWMCCDRCDAAVLVASASKPLMLSSWHVTQHALAAARKLFCKHTQATFALCVMSRPDIIARCAATYPRLH